MNSNESTETNLNKRVRLCIARRGKNWEKERERERGREICNSSVASHRWWVEASSGASMLARIKGGFKTSAEHQSSNQGTAATMRAFMVSSPSTTISPISHFLLSSFLHSLLDPFIFFSPVFLFGSSSMFLFSRIRELSRRMIRPWEKRGEFVIQDRDRNWDRRFHPRAGGGRTREKVKERGGCAGSIVCGVNVLRDSDYNPRTGSVIVPLL